MEEVSRVDRNICAYTAFRNNVGDIVRAGSESTRTYPPCERALLVFGIAQTSQMPIKQASTPNSGVCQPTALSWVAGRSSRKGFE